MLDLFQPDAHRLVCHVADIVMVIDLVISSPARKSRTYNVGGNFQNYTKRGLVEIIISGTGAKIEAVSKEDNRDYRWISQGYKRSWDSNRSTRRNPHCRDWFTSGSGRIKLQGDSMRRVMPHFVPYWGREEMDAVSDILENLNYLNEHKMVRSFENSFTEYVDAKYCVAMLRGTTTLYCAINALNLQGGKSIRIPTHDGIFAFNALLAAGGSPEICDVDSHGMLDVGSTEGCEGDRSAIMVHANGRIAKNMALLEDCSQVIFHHTRGRVSTYSFASTKHITTGGQGEAICCDDSDTFDALVRIKDHGRNDRQLLRPMSDSYDAWGMNFKMTEIQATFGLAQMRDIDRRMRRFREICSIYRDLLGDAVSFDEDEPGWYVDVFTPGAENIRQGLREKRIYCRSYPKPLHMQTVASGYIGTADFPVAERMYRPGLYLPSTTNLSDEDVKRVAEEILHVIA